jgi:hypothetical protein
MFTQSAIAVAIVVGITFGALAATKQNGNISTWTPRDCRGVYVGSDAKILINRPRHGMCYIEE